MAGCGRAHQRRAQDRLAVRETPLGILADGAFNYGFFSLNDSGQSTGAVNNLVSFQKFGTGATGSRTAIIGHCQQAAVTSGSNTFRDYVGVTGVGESLLGDGGTNTGAGALGAVFGGNFESRLGAGATNMLAAVGVEIDVFGVSGSSAKYNWALSLCAGYATTVGSLHAALAIYSIGASSPYPAGSGFGNGIIFSEIASSTLPPVSATATLFGAHLETHSTISAAKGIDLTKFVFSGNAYASNGFSVAQSGNITVTVASASAFDIRSGASGSFSEMTIGRTTQEGALGVAGGSNNFFSGTVAGDWALQGTNNVFLGSAGTGVVKLFSNNNLGATLDASQNLNLVGSYQKAGTQVVGARVTGYAAMTGSPDKGTTYATGSITLAQLAGRMMQLQADLTTHGLIGT